MASGASLIALTVMTKVCGSDVSSPPLAVPPSSWTYSVMFATPFLLAAGVNVSVPSEATAGPAEKSVGLSLLSITNVTPWPPSLGPAEMPVAQPATDCAPASSSTV